VLQDSLGGTSQTVLIVCCSPDATDAVETVSSLRFGSRFQGINNVVRANAVTHLQSAEQLGKMLQAAQVRRRCRAR
jgi:kinesin family protein 5